MGARRSKPSRARGGAGRQPVEPPAPEAAAAPEPTELLLDSAKSGDARALSDLLRRVQGRLELFARKRGLSSRRNPVVQTMGLVDHALLELHRNVAKVNDVRHLFNRAILVMRRAMPRKKPGGRAVPVDLEAIPDWRGAPDFAEAEDLIEQLPKELAKFVHPRWYLGMTVKEVADHTKTPLKTVEVRLKRAKEWIEKRRLGPAPRP